MGCVSSKEKEAASELRQQQEQQDRHAANWETSALCKTQLRDPLALAISFMASPGPFRGVCIFTVECWDHSRYLEMPLACSLAFLDTTRRWCPLGLQRLCKIPHPTQYHTLPCILTFAGRLVTGGNTRNVASNVAYAHTGPVTELLLQDDALESVGDYWLLDCSSLNSVTLGPFPKLQSVGDRWFFHCTSLTSVTFVDLPELTSVGPDWLAGCESLESVVFEHLGKLHTVKEKWLQECTSLKSVSFVDLPELAVVGDYWLAGCKSLETITIGNLPKLRSAGRCWVSNCASLVSATFVDMPELTRVGGGRWDHTRWLAWCDSLKSATFERLPKLEFSQEELQIDLPTQCVVQWNV